jgi:ERCC4-type nuclease
VIRILRQLGGVKFAFVAAVRFDLSVAHTKSAALSSNLIHSLAERAQEVVQVWNERTFGHWLLLAVRELAPRTRETLRQGGISWVEETRAYVTSWLPAS